MRARYLVKLANQMLFPIDVPDYKTIQERTKENYIQGLKGVRDRSAIMDLIINGSLGTGLGAAAGIGAGGLAAAATYPFGDKSFNDNLNNKTSAGVIIGSVLGGGAGVLSSVLTRDKRREKAIKELAALGVKD